jgi:hypothetical protein
LCARRRTEIPIGSMMAPAIATDRAAADREKESRHEATSVAVTVVPTRSMDPPAIATPRPCR